LTEKTVLLVKKITKFFPGVKALDDVSMEINSGEIHGIVGANGAGKSTLINILSGYIRADSGEIFLNGKKIVFDSPMDSIKKGIITVHQEIDILRYLTVAQNIFMGYESKFTNFGLINIRRMNSEARDILKSLDLSISATETMGNLSTANQQMIMIASALAKNARVMIFDEPTSALSVNEIESFFKQVLKLKQNDVSIIYISHHLDEVMRLADRATILKDGKVVNLVNIPEVKVTDIINSMLGMKLMQNFKTENKSKDKIALSVSGLKTKNNKVNGVSFDLYEQEVLGIYGVVGSGRTEMAKSIFLNEEKESGDIKIEGKNISIKNAQSAIGNGIVYSPQDKKGEGLFLDLDVNQNITITVISNFIKFGLINKKMQSKTTDEFIKKLNIKTPSRNQEVKFLSGGNQQKVVLSKWLATNSKIFILDEPTVGIDVGAKQEILKLTLELSKAGKSVIILSSEIEELMEICDRILVMRRGKIINEFKSGNYNSHEIIATAVGGKI
jgi:ribose transport system ATP-binding protein